jgi:hypothetical protein
MNTQQTAALKGMVDDIEGGICEDVVFESQQEVDRFVNELVAKIQSITFTFNEITDTEDEDWGDSWVESHNKA